MRSLVLLAALCTSTVLAAPTLVNVNPPAGPTVGGSTLFLFGMNFDPPLTISVGGLDCLVTGTPTATAAQCTLPAGVGANLDVVLTSRSSGPSNAVKFSYFPPTLGTLTPSSGGTAGGISITLSGAHFGAAGATVTVGGTPCPVTTQTQASVACTLPAGVGASRPVILTVGGQSSNSLLFSYTPPSLSSLTPSSSDTPGGTALTLSGANFGASGASVTVGGNACPVTLQGHTSVRCTVPAGVGTNQPVVLTTGAQSSNSLSLSYNPPSLSSLTPTSGSTAGGTTLTLQGTNFGASGAAVSVGGSACPVLTQSHTSLTCALPAGVGVNQLVRLAVGGQTSGTLSFSYDPPFITGLSPSSASTAGGTALTVSGTSFGASGAAVTVGGASCPVTMQSHTSITCTLPAGVGTNQLVRVSVGGQDSNAASFSYSAPSLTSLSPANGSSAGGFAMTIGGASLGAAGALITIGGSACPVTVQSHTSITCTVPAGVGANQPVVVTVGGQTSNTLSFSYNAPSLTGIAPASGGTAGGAAMTISGTSFGASGAVVTVGGNACPVTTQTHTSITCTVPAGVGANQPVRVTVGGQSSNTLGFTYTPPVLSSLSPTNGATAGGVPLVLTGSNFGASGATVTVGGTACPVTAQSHTSVTCTQPAGVGTSLPVVLTVGGQASNSLSFSYNAPTLSSLTPTSGSTAGGALLTVNGTNFGASGATITVGGTACPVTTQSHTAASCTLPAGVGVNQTVRLTTGGQGSNALTFSYDAPTISGVSGVRPTQGGSTITLAGQSFGASGGAVTVAGNACPISTQTHTTVSCVLPAGQGAMNEVRYTVAGQVGTATLAYDAPLVSQFTPAEGARAGGQTLTLSGANFGTTAAVSIAGQSCPVSTQSHTQLTCGPTPAGAGNVPVLVTVAGQSTSAMWRYLNRAPVVPPTQSVQLVEDTPATFPLDGGDPDGDPLTWRVVQALPVDAGAVTTDGGVFTWTPRADFFGTETFQARASDGELESSDTLVSLVVQPVNDAPVALPVSGSTAEETPVTIAPLASDVDSSALTTLVSRAPDAGVAMVSVDSSQRLVVTPAADFAGTFSFGYRVNDGQLSSAEADVTVQVANLNDAPVALAGMATTMEEAAVDVTLSGADVDGDALTYALVSPPAEGSVTLTGAVARYAPPKDFVGEATFTFRANDGVLFSAPATVRVTVMNVNDAPVASAVSGVTSGRAPVTLQLLATDIDGDALTFQVTRAPPSSEGVVALAGATATFTAGPGFVGTSTFDFEARDGQGGASTATASVVVRPGDLPPSFILPTPTADVQGRAGEALSFQLAASDDVGPVTYDVRGRPAAATIDAATGVFRWTPADADVGMVPVVLVASDGLAETTRPITLVITARAAGADGGTGGGGGSDGGGGCACTSVEAPWLLALAVVALRRRSRRRA
jgi:hypothetical protein